MAAQTADPLADELALGWGEDTIYCGATCDPEDVLYEGSDDENYDNPISRKLRIEAAGQRFLDGKTPVLLTALLRGPFDAKSSNWVNPWRSKHRTAGNARIIRTSPGKLKRSANVRRSVSIPETVQPASDSLECHLPSPESLNQTSETEIHPYLEEDELAKVREWRDAVDAEKKPKDEFWASTPQGSLSERKRKAKGSSWLKHLANKRRRTDVMETGSIDTPVPSRNQTSLSATKAFNTSFSSVPDRLPSSAIATKRFFSTPQHEQPTSEDELSCDKVTLDRASAPSSSPLSCLQYTPVLDSHANISSQDSTDQQTPSKVSVPQRGSVPGTADLGAQGEAASNPTPRPAFETQEDASFCFKMRPKLNQDVGAASDQDVSMSRDEDTWSGLSSPNNDMASTISDPQESTPAEEGRSLRDSESAMEIDQIAMTSPLSSISSKEFRGFDISEEPHSRPDSASGSSMIDTTPSDSKLTSYPSQESAEEVIVLVAEEMPSECQQDTESEDEDMGGTADVTSSLAVTENHEGSVTASVGESSEEEEEVGKAKATEVVSPTTINNRTPQPLTGRREAETTPSKSTTSKLGNDSSTPSHAEYLLRTSIKKRFIPESSWEKLAKLTGSPSYQSLPQRRASLPSKQASNSPSGRRKTASVQSTPKKTTPRRALSLPQPSLQNVRPTVVDSPAKEQQLEQQRQPNSPKDTRISFSQQTPWVDNKLCLGQISTDSPMSESKETGTIVAESSPVEQTPWTNEMAELPTIPLALTPVVEIEDRTAVEEPNTPAVASQVDTPLQDASAAATTVIESTPEPQFSVKSFASFRSTSPAHSSRRSKRAVWRGSGARMPSTQGILASATKNPWVVRSSERRVSFAPLPHETKGYSSNPTTPCPSTSKRRQGSPPPDTPMSELPTSGDDKFHKHFDAVARGPIIRHKQRLLPSESQRLLPSESQRTVGSPMPDAMAEAFLSADQLRQSTPPADPTKSDRESDESQDPMEMAEDVFREMDHVFEWNLSGTDSSPQKTQGQQSPW